MIRPITLTSFAIAAMLGFALFKVKYEVQTLETKLVQVERQTAIETEAIHILKASWSTETRPQALAALADRHLGLKPMTPSEISSYDTLPLNEREPVEAPMAAAIPAPLAAPAPDVAIAAAMSPQPIAPAQIAMAETSADAVDTETDDAPDPQPAPSPRARHAIHVSPKQLASLSGRGMITQASAESEAAPGDASVDAVLAAMQASSADRRVR